MNQSGASEITEQSDASEITDHVNGRLYKQRWLIERLSFAACEDDVLHEFRPAQGSDDGYY